MLPGALDGARSFDTTRCQCLGQVRYIRFRLCLVRGKVEFLISCVDAHLLVMIRWCLERSRLKVTHPNLWQAVSPAANTRINRNQSGGMIHSGRWPSRVGIIVLRVDPPRRTLFLSSINAFSMDLVCDESAVTPSHADCTITRLGQQNEYSTD